MFLADILVYDSVLMSLLLILILIPFGFASVVLTWKNPGLVFGLFLAIPFYKAATDIILPIDITGALWILLLLPTMQLVMNPARYRLRYGVVFAWLSILMIVLGSMVASMLFGRFPVDGEPVQYIVNYVLLLWVPGFAAFRVVGERRTLKQMLWTLATTGGLTITFGLVSFQSLGEADRLTALGSNTIGTARSALWVVFIVVPLLWHRKALRLPLTVLVAAAFFVAFSSGSRGPVLFALLATITIILIQTNRTKILSYVVAIGFAMPLVAFVVTRDFVRELLPSQSLWRIEEFVKAAFGMVAGQDVDWDTSSATRFQLWDVGWQMFADNPILGNGAGTFGYVAESHGLDGYHDGPHNLFMNILAELGLIGALVLGAILVIAALRTVHQHSYPEIVAITGLFVFRMYETLVGTGLADRQSWLIFAMMLAVPLTFRDDQRDLPELQSASIPSQS